MFFEAQENMGLPATLNKALVRTKGKYYVPFGSDDIMMLDRLEKQVAYMESKTDIGICACSILKINATGDILPDKQKFHPQAVLDFYDIFLERKSKGPAPTLLFRTDAIRSTGGFNPEIRLEDVYIQLNMTRQGHKLGFLNDVLAYYRIHPTNTYKDIEFMYSNAIKTYACFSEAPYYPLVMTRFLHSMLLKTSRKNKPLARKILSEIQLRFYRMKTVRGLIKIFF
ncbi:MAG: glycosyltransferase [Porticoccaceae bacterium]